MGCKSIKKNNKSLTVKNQIIGALDEGSKDLNKNGTQETSTPRKINMEPENDGLEDDYPFPGVYSQVPC